MVTSFSFFSITDFLQSNISSCIVNVSFNHMHFIVLVSIWGILVCIFDLIFVFVVTLVSLNSVCIATNKPTCAKSIWTSTNTPTCTMSIGPYMDMSIGVTNLSFVYSNLCSNGSHGLESTFYFSLTFHIIVENLCQHTRWKDLAEDLDIIFINLFTIFYLIIMYSVVLTTHWCTFGTLWSILNLHVFYCFV